jgi:HSP20 family molecular chaperone IbpA
MLFLNKLRWSKLLVLLALVTVGFTVWSQGKAESPRYTTERAKLDQLLGQTDPLPPLSKQESDMSVRPPSSTGSANNEFFKQFFEQQGQTMPPSFETLSDSFEKMQQQAQQGGDGPVKVVEDATHYTISIELHEAEDAKGVVVTAHPHQIAINGTLHPDAHSAQSFMKTFTTSATVNPEGMTRTLSDNGKRLVVKIPKLGSTPPTPGAGAQGETSGLDSAEGQGLMLPQAPHDGSVI